MSDQSSGPPTFVQWLKRLRRAQDLTQEALAERMFCSIQTIRFLEAGSRRPSIDMAERLADVLGVPATERDLFVRRARIPAAEEPPAGSPSPMVDTTGAGSPDVPLAGAPEQESTSTIYALPTVVTPLIGRAAESKRLQQLLREERQRLVTVVGAGGMGKTRLAIHCAQAVAAIFPHGVGYVALASVEQTDYLPVAVADALNISLQGVRDPAEQVYLALATRQMLLVLDNFEQLLGDDHAVTWVKTLLARAPGVQLLITSRERLRIGGESVVELGGLALEEEPRNWDKAEATMLFLARAQATAGNFVLNSSNGAAVRRICQLVGGMPLGIELAAAWVRVLSCEEIADELQRNLDFLALAARDMEGRHRSMRAVFDHSWRLLTADERRVFQKLAVFRGGCDRAAGVQVAGATLPLLAGLIDKSLLQREESEKGGRYVMHELVRQYAALQLAANPEVAQQTRQDYTTYYRQWVEAGRWTLDQQSQTDWFTQIERERDNLYQALEWLDEQRDGVAFGQLISDLWWFWYRRSRWQEGRQWIERAIARLQNGWEELPIELPAQLLTGHGAFLWMLGELTLSAESLEESIARWHRASATPRSTTGLAYALSFLGWTRLRQGNPAVAKVHMTESVARFRQVQDRWGLAHALGGLRQVLVMLAEYAQAQQAIGESAGIWREVGDPWGLALALNAQGELWRLQGNAAAAEPCYDESLALFRQSGDGGNATMVLINRTHALVQLGKGREAATGIAEATKNLMGMESRDMAVWAAIALAAVAGMTLEQPTAAARCVELLAAATAAMQRWGLVLDAADQQVYDQLLVKLQAQLTVAEFEEWWERGAGLVLADTLRKSHRGG